MAIDLLPVYRGAYDSRARWLHLYGGAGSGKSYFAASKVVLRCYEAPAQRILLIREHFKHIRNSQFRLIQETIARGGQADNWRANRTELSLTCSNGSEILSYGLDDLDKLKSVVDPTYAWIEEATQVRNADAIDQVGLRLRGATPGYQQIILTYNPVRKTHPIKKRFHDADRDDTFILKTTHRDNPYVDQSYAKALQNLNPDQRRIYAEGEWGEQLRGLIYSDVQTGMIPDEAPDAIGIDFGVTAPTAVVAVWLRDSFLFVRELMYEKGLTNSDLIERLPSLVPDRSVPIFCDAAEPGRIIEIQRAGFKASAANKEVLKGIDSVRRFQIVLSRDSTNLADELDGYAWLSTPDGELTDRPQKHRDHAADAMRYAVRSFEIKPTGLQLW
jgi:phage terminase large subunit